MFKNSITAILAGFLIAAVAGAAAAYELKAALVPDGFGLMGVDGKLTGENETDRWFFKFDDDVSNRLGQINAGTRLEVLPSAALEKMIANLQQYPDVSPVRSKSPEATAEPTVQTSNGASYRLWGKVTKYRQKNYIFADYFLPISEVSRQKPAITEESQQESATADKSEITINESNDELAMPEAGSYLPLTLSAEISGQSNFNCCRVIFSRGPRDARRSRQTLCDSKWQGL